MVRATLSTAYGTSRRRWHCQCASLASLWLRPLALQAEDVQNDGVGTPTGWYVSATYLLAGALGTRRRYSLTGAIYGRLGARRARSSNRPARSCRGARCTPLEPIVRANSSGMYRPSAQRCACSAHSARAGTCSVRVRFLLAVAKLRCSRLWKELSEYATLPHSNHNVQHTNALLEGAVRARSAPHTAYTTSHSACAKNQVERAFWTDVSTVHATRCRHNPQQPNRAPLRCSRAAAHLWPLHITRGSR